MAKKTIVGAVADSVTGAVVSTIEAITHPVKTAQEAGNAIAKARRGAVRTAGSTVRAGKRKMAAGKKATRKAARKVASRAKRVVRQATRKARKVTKKATKKATKRAKRR